MRTENDGILQMQCVHETGHIHKIGQRRNTEVVMKQEVLQNAETGE